MPTVPINGGGGTSPGAYEIISSVPTVELVGVADLRDVQEVTVRADPSNVIFHIRIIMSAYDLPTVEALAGGYAGYFNAMVQIPGVAAVTNYQDVNAGDQIYDVMQITVTSTTGRTSFPMTSESFGRNLDEVAAAVAAQRQQLDAIEAGH